MPEALPRCGQFAGGHIKCFGRRQQIGLVRSEECEHRAKHGRLAQPRAQRIGREPGQRKQAFGAVGIRKHPAQRGESQTAIAIQEDVFERRRAVLGPEHPDTLSAAMNLASSLLAVDRVNEAKALAEPHQLLRERVLGAQHPDTLTSLEILAGIAHERGEIDVARGHLEAALSGWESSFGRERPQTLVSAARLVEFERAHRPEQALAVQARYLDAFLSQPEESLSAPMRAARQAVLQRLEPQRK